MSSLLAEQNPLQSRAKWPQWLRRMLSSKQTITADGTLIADGMPELLTDPAKREEAAAVLAACEQHLRPVTDSEDGQRWLAHRIDVLLAHGRDEPVELPPRLAQAIGSDWLRLLGRYPRWAIADAVDDYLLREPFRACIADISLRCETSVAGLRLDARQLKAAVGDQQQADGVAA